MIKIEKRRAVVDAQHFRVIIIRSDSSIHSASSPFRLRWVSQKTRPSPESSISVVHVVQEPVRRGMSVATRQRGEAIHLSSQVLDGSFSPVTFSAVHSRRSLSLFVVHCAGGMTTIILCSGRIGAMSFSVIECQRRWRSVCKGSLMPSLIDEGSRILVYGAEPDASRPESLFISAQDPSEAPINGDLTPGSHPSVPSPAPH